MSDGRPITAADHWRAKGQLTEANARPDGGAVNVIPFDLSVHGPMLDSWTGARGIAVPHRLLPKGGRIVEDVAAGFMYRTDSPVAILEPIVANPDAPADLRDVAIDRILGALFDMLRTDGYEMVWAWSAHPAVVERCERLGFERGQGTRTFGSRIV